MNTNWAKILLFSLLFLVLGFLLGRLCGAGCGTSGCGPGGMRGGTCMMHGGMGGDACMHGRKGKCCAMQDDSAMDPHAAAPAPADSAAMKP
ncbi:MAG: hypothetical protein J5I62_14160 [Flavobacteriales bacterium]|nr:hypothetical protein [Flavobacteriales bacterium]MEB2341237.1 hypothetical protein [Flavobacteriia bacterium]